MHPVRRVRDLARAALGVLLLTAALVGQETTRVSVSSSGTEGDRDSFFSAISADGQIVAFQSDASNLVAGDTNGWADVFVHDRFTGLTERVSVDSSGAQGNKYGSNPAISVDGQVVAFASWASNLVAGDMNGQPDVFVHDRVTGITERVSVDSSGAEQNGPSWESAISANGQVVAFSSEASNLVAGDTNQWKDVFVHDLVTGITDRVSVDSSGRQGNGESILPAISADGCIVAFNSDASNLVAGDTNGAEDIFIHDRVTGRTELVSVDSSGVHGNGYCYYSSISAGGQLVAFDSYSTNLVSGDTNKASDIFVHDRATGITRRVSVDSSGAPGNGDSFKPAISADGQLVAFYSEASNLVAGDTNSAGDIFVHDCVTGRTQRVNVDSSGAQGNGNSWFPAISADGRVVAFESEASNFVSGDTNGVSDVFVHDRCTDATWTNYGSGFPGTLGVPTIGLSSDPILGTTLTLDISNSLGATTIGLLSFGLDKAQHPTTWGGDFLVDSRFPPVLIQLPAAGFSLLLNIPDVGLYCGLELYWQTLELDPGAAHGVSFTAGLETVLGR